MSEEHLDRGAIAGLLRAFLENCDHLEWAMPSSAKYPELRQIYNQSSKAVPLAISCPKTAQDIANLVQFATRNEIGIAIRVGGNDIFARSMIDGALVLDLRAINSVVVDERRSSAKIGGGVLAGDLVAVLAEHGLATPTGAIPFVGYAGWATLGGYGPFSSHLGLGVDQILGATIVTANGEIVKADQELLKGIRGAGGSFGAIVEMEIKVYPLQKILAGILLLESSDLAKTFKAVINSLQLPDLSSFPEALGIQPVVLNLPSGRTCGIEVLWSSPDLQLGHEYIDKLAVLLEVAHSHVLETTISEWMQATKSVVPLRSYGTNRTLTVHKLTDEMVSMICNHIYKMPDDKGVILSLHILRGSSAKPNEESVSPVREPHIVIEMIGTTSESKNEGVVAAWALGFRDELAAIVKEGKGLLSSWAALTPPSEATLNRLYGTNSEYVLNLRRKYDPHNLFISAIAQFPI